MAPIQCSRSAMTRQDDCEPIYPSRILERTAQAPAAVSVSLSPTIVARRHALSASGSLAGPRRLQQNPVVVKSCTKEVSWLGNRDFEPGLTESEFVNIRGISVINMQLKQLDK